MKKTEAQEFREDVAGIVSYVRDKLDAVEKKLAAGELVEWAVKDVIQGAGCLNAYVNGEEGER